MRLGGTITRGLCLASALSLCSPVFAQDSGGLNGSFTFAQGLTLEDGDTFGQTNLGFAITDTTKRENFAFRVDTQILQRFDNGIDVGVRDPSLALSYGIQSRQSQLTTSLRYRRADADTLTEGLDGTLVIDNGEREDVNANVALEFGREAPFGGAITLGYAETLYSGTQSAELVDNNVLNGAVNLRFEVGKQITATLGYSQTETERTGQQDSRSQSLNVGANFAVNPTLVVNTSLGQSKVTNTLGAISQTSQGLTYGLSVTQQRPNGALSFNLSSNIAETGRRTTAQISRSLETKRGRVSGRFGVSEGTDNKLRPLYQLSYSEELPRGSYTINVDQAFTVNSLSEEVLNSAVRMAWQQDLTQQSSLRTNIDWQRIDVIGDSSNSSRLDLNLNYRQQLSQDWTFLARARRSWLTDTDTGDDQQSEIFIGFQAAFAWRP